MIMMPFSNGRRDLLERLESVGADDAAEQLAALDVSPFGGAERLEPARPAWGRMPTSSLTTTCFGGRLHARPRSTPSVAQHVEQAVDAALDIGPLVDDAAAELDHHHRMLPPVDGDGLGGAGIDRAFLALRSGDRGSSSRRLRDSASSFQM